ncbi:SgcJ/EcaC family oxidoreductase [Phytoactinopolyspora alkaliphila]|uniref:SgcJ/EcaC family oxidoreductase n=1 Tax=Phytoactinopolyspora alkaliphila TaxID=1783498 RepID=A0A6N9YLU1_9ACTN|nr:SgcJ/EcaC family oxidoreductase [Phytoactinopolyspora alkaliphila]NED96041.1 SgcJ/EcaC family oxidoreductase [Phytoactinopolyspora alkaliphila]
MPDEQDAAIRITQGSSSDDGVRRTIAAAEKHQNDVEPFLDLHTDTAVIVNIAGRRVLGRSAIEDAMRAALASPLANVLTKIEIEDIRYLRPDVVLVSCVKHVSDEREAEAGGEKGPTVPTRGTLTYIMVEDDGTWRIALAQTTPVRAG